MILNSADSFFAGVSNPWAIAGIVLLVIWTITWKGLALWKAARLSHRKWFVVFLIVNTLGILELIYINFIAKKYSVEVVDGEETK